MARHDITELGRRLAAAGGSVDSLLALRDVEQIGDELIAWNRRAEAAAHQLVEKAEHAHAAGTQAVDKAQRMLDAVRSGQICFTRSARGHWLVVGPAAELKPGAAVTVTKAGGATARVRVDVVEGSYEKQGVAYAVASFHHLSKAAAQEPARPRTVHHAFFGRGVQYGDGATVYDSGHTQIWDD